LKAREKRALVGLDMRPVGDARIVANLLRARDVALDTIHVDDKGRCSVIAGDLLRERGGQGRIPFLCGDGMRRGVVVQPIGL